MLAFICITIIAYTCLLAFICITIITYTCLLAFICITIIAYMCIRNMFKPRFSYVLFGADVL